jgi:hypothetical protein
MTVNVHGTNEAGSGMPDPASFAMFEGIELCR